MPGLGGANGVFRFSVGAWLWQPDAAKSRYINSNLAKISTFWSVVPRLVGGKIFVFGKSYSLVLTTGLRRKKIAKSVDKFSSYDTLKLNYFLSDFNKTF